MTGDAWGTATRVKVEGSSHRIRGWIAYDDEWVAYLLVDARWLCVEDDHGLTFSVWEDQDSDWVLPDDAELTSGGTQYRRFETDRARWMAAGIEA